MNLRTIEINDVTKGILMMLLAVFFFSFMDIAIKWLSAHYTPFQVSFYRGITSLPFILVWIYFSGSFKDLKTSRLGFHVLRGALSILFLAGVVIGLRELTVANAYSIFFSAPLLIAVLSIFFLHERIGIHRWMAIVIGLIGVLITLNPTGDDILSLGALACIISVIGYSFTVIIIKMMADTESTFAMVFYFLVTISVGCGILAVFDWKPFQWSHWDVLIVLGLSGSLGQVFITAAFKLAPASVIAPLDYTALFWGSIMAFWIWGEVPTSSIWLGAGIIISSGLYLMYRESKQSDN